MACSTLRSERIEVGLSDVGDTAQRDLELGVREVAVVGQQVDVGAVRASGDAVCHGLLAPTEGIVDTVPEFASIAERTECEIDQDQGDDIPRQRRVRLIAENMANQAEALPPPAYEG